MAPVAKFATKPAAAAQGNRSAAKGAQSRAGAKGPVQEVAKFAAALGASVSLAGAAYADTEVKAGGDDGSLVFIPDTVTIKTGETVKFVNNKAGPHNVVFEDEDAVPSGVDPDKISNEEYMNQPGEVQTVKLDTPGTYYYVCEPHAGAGMSGKIVVQE